MLKTRQKLLLFVLWLAVSFVSCFLAVGLLSWMTGTAFQWALAGGLSIGIGGVIAVAAAFARRRDQDDHAE